MKKIVGTLFILFMVNMAIMAQLSGDYYIGATPGSRPGGGDPEYTSLGAAFSALNTQGVSGPCEFYFLDASYTETSNLALACTGTSEINTILFKPYIGVTTTINFTQLADNAGPTGRIVIGSNTTASYTLIPVSYVTFDGSNQVGGSSKDLSITEVNNSVSYSYGIRVVGDVSYCTIKNINMTISETGSSSSYGILITPRNQNSTDYIPNNITIKNCTINIVGGNACQGVSISASGTLSSGVYPSNIKIQNNVINARTRGVFLSTGTGDTEISGNIISITQTGGGTLSEGIYAYSVANSSKTINIFNNQITNLTTANSSSGDYGIIGIYIGTIGTYNVYNNVICGFNPTTSAANPSCVLDGIRVYTATTLGVTANLFANTILIPEMTITPGSGTVIPRGIVTGLSGASGVKQIDSKNNIVISSEGDFLTYAMYRTTTDESSLVTNYNNFFVSGSGKVGFNMGSDCTSLSDWQTSTSQDANSISKSVEFVSSTDLHLSGASIGDNDLTGTVIASYITDIDGDTRDLVFPYMGADENTTSPLHLNTPRTVPMSAAYSNEVAFGTNGLLGSDGTTKFYTHWDANYLYLGWTGGRTNYSSDLFYAAIDTDPDGANGTTEAINGVSFLSGSPNPDYYIVFENNSSFYGVPTSNGNAFEFYTNNSGTWNWVSRTDGNDNTNSYVTFVDGNGEIRVRVAWTALNFTPAVGTKIGLVMWTNNSDGNYMWGRVPTTNPVNGATPKLLENEFVFAGSGDGINPNVDGVLTALPVELTSFSASACGTTVNLAWSTATELNAYSFEIERSEDNNNWSCIGSVSAHGNSSTINDYEYLDELTNSGKYYYRLKQIDNDGAYEFSDVVDVNVGTPESYSLSQNYPNPFNPTTTINYSLPLDSRVTINIYSITGELVRSLVNEDKSAGSYSVELNASDLASGTYFYRLIANDFVQTKKMLLIK